MDQVQITFKHTRTDTLMTFPKHLAVIHISTELQMVRRSLKNITACRVYKAAIVLLHKRIKRRLVIQEKGASGRLDIAFEELVFCVFFRSANGLSEHQGI